MINFGPYNRRLSVVPSFAHYVMGENNLAIKVNSRQLTRAW